MTKTDLPYNTAMNTAGDLRPAGESSHFDHASDIVTLRPDLVFVITSSKIIPETRKRFRKTRLAIIYNLR